MATKVPNIHRYDVWHTDRIVSSGILAPNAQTAIAIATEHRSPTDVREVKCSDIYEAELGLEAGNSDDEVFSITIRGTSPKSVEAFHRALRILIGGPVLSTEEQMISSHDGGSLLIDEVCEKEYMVVGFN